MPRDYRFLTASERNSVLSGIDDKIARIAALRAEIEALSNSIEQDRFYIATHRRLPPEVLGEIFAECAAHSHQWWLAPIVISHVSKHWRDVVHHTPRAWTYLCLKIIPRPSTCAIVKIYLERSASCPLNLHFKTLNCLTAQEAIRCGALASVLSLLRPVVSRWIRMTIIIGDGPHSSVWNAQALLNHFEFSNMPMLESFQLDTSLWQGYHVLRDTSMPRLRTLTIGHCRPSLANPWLSRITHLILNRATHSFIDIHRLLQACPLLEILELDALIPDREPPPGLPPLILPHLQHIYINDLTFMPFLRPASLTTLELSKLSAIGVHEGFMVITSLRMLLTMSHCNTFRELSLKNIDVGFVGLSCLKDIPTLEILSLENCPVSDRAFGVLQDPSLGPCLHTLRLAACDSIHWCSLMNVIGTRNRKNALNPLQRVELFDCMSLTEEGFQELCESELVPRVIWSRGMRSTDEAATVV